MNTCHEKPKLNLLVAPELNYFLLKTKLCTHYLKQLQTWFGRVFNDLEGALCCVSLCVCFTGELYVSDKCGSDQDGDGTEQKPFKTPLKVNSRVA